MVNVMQWVFLLTTTGLVVANDRLPTPQPSDITSINNLRDKHGLETVVLKILKRITASGVVPDDFPQADYLRLLSSHQALSEDLGSVESTGDQSQNNEYQNNNDDLIGEKKVNNEKQFTREVKPEEQDSQYENYNTNPTRSYNDQDYFTTLAVTNPTIPNNITRKDGKQPEQEDLYVDTTTNIPNTNPPTQNNYDFHYKIEQTDSSQDSKTQPPDNSVRFYTVTRNDENDEREEKVEYLEQNFEKENQKKLEETAGIGNQSDLYMKREKTSDEENADKFSAQYEFHPSAAEFNFVPTKPTNQLVMGPTPIDIPDERYKKEENTPTQRSSSAINSESHEKTNKSENVRHTVEFAASPLVAAFTVQQDDNGVPRNIIPLDYSRPSVAPVPTANPDLVAQKQRELEEKEYILYKQLQTLQNEKNKYISPQLQQQRQNLLSQRQEEIKQHQLRLQLEHHKELQRQEELRRQNDLRKQQASFNNLNYNYHYHQNYQHLPHYNHRDQQTHQGFQAPVDYFRYQKSLNQEQQQLRNTLYPPSEIEFHKSVDFSLPQYENNRVYRREPGNFVGNFGFTKPPSVSGQIQSLINTSGVSRGLPRNTQADLNVISKILALNHGTLELNTNQRENQNSLHF